MNSAHRTPFDAGVYDPSHRRAETSSYWQWATGSLGGEWTLAAERVNTGWPAKGGLFDPGAKWYGFIADKDGKCWIYRLYAAGRDSFGREGRYFFVLVRLDIENLLSPEVAGLFRYFESERGLPLRTLPLDQGWPEAAPDEVLEALGREARQGNANGHWGIDDQLRVTVFTEPPRTDWRGPNPSPTSKRSGRPEARPSSKGILPGKLAKEVRDFWKRYGLIYLLVVFTLVISLFGWWWWRIRPPTKPPRPVPPPTQAPPAPSVPSDPAQTPEALSNAPSSPPGAPETSIENDKTQPEDGSEVPENLNPKREDVQ